MPFDSPSPADPSVPETDPTEAQATALPADQDTAQGPRIDADVVITPAAGVDGAEAFPGLLRRVLAYNDRLMLVEHVMEEGSVFPRHSHPHEQLAYLVSGRVRVVAGDETFEAGPGDSFVVRGGVEHQVWALERSVALDVFTPFREDYVEWVDGR
ncbi:cupin domain-containing protein [Actinoalloteichus hymeniacidonis]|uniref:Double-stranded beta-helix domain-containing protein n=1 Tax=Actinoalloteichus hymeniacidonis TaxID=340345 RepID=A0AAC9HP27_9PSEU|nr:cupin domain-containing protein [Actinoalloteichus hymeniacidonis]AOS62812.1 double-stranded beta-helix domain-containing protein [Actinoalloteichus hymeniacidonis]MBB5909157.1 quercetin dioxygenase-like cupin family protein [Actinoalloteichus hymeniacidonis]